MSASEHTDGKGYECGCRRAAARRCTSVTGSAAYDHLWWDLNVCSETPRPASIFQRLGMLLSGQNACCRCLSSCGASGVVRIEPRFQVYIRNPQGY